MAELDIGQAATPTEIADYKISSESTDGINAEGETFWDNPNWTEFYGKYLSTTKLKAKIKAYATWIVGLGYTTDTRTQVILDNIKGSGEDTTLSIFWNMIVIKKINGDAYAEIIRNKETGTLINLKPLAPDTVRVVFGTNGIIKRYEQRSTVKGGKNTIIPIENMFHLVNDRIADETHGDSVIDSLIWNIESQEEARRMFRRKVKNSGIMGILKMDTEDQVKIEGLKPVLKKGMEEGIFLMVPDDVIDVQDWGMKLDTQGIVQWLNYLADEEDQIIGIPKIITGGSGEIEGDSKIAYLTFEPKYKREIKEFEDDLWNQLAVKIKINLPPSLKEELQSNEQANTSQTGFQPNDTTAGVGA